MAQEQVREGAGPYYAQDHGNGAGTLWGPGITTRGAMSFGAAKSMAHDCNAAYAAGEAAGRASQEAMIERLRAAAKAADVLLDNTPMDRHGIPDLTYMGTEWESLAHALNALQPGDLGPEEDKQP